MGSSILKNRMRLPHLTSQKQPHAEGSHEVVYSKKKRKRKKKKLLHDNPNWSLKFLLGIPDSSAATTTRGEGEMEISRLLVQSRFVSENAREGELKFGRNGTHGLCHSGGYRESLSFRDRAIHREPLFHFYENQSLAK